jgi:hypothetical protein
VPPPKHNIYSTHELTWSALAMTEAHEFFTLSGDVTQITISSTVQPSEVLR